MSNESESVQPYKGVDDNEIREIARTFSRASLSSLESGIGSFVNVFEEHDNSALDPNSGSFKARDWLKNMRNLYRSDPDRYPTKELGISFRNLSAFGQGQDANFQKTVATAPLSAFYKLKEVLGSKSSSRRVQILHPMDGVINPGEMLLVLGRPGSGCSTFLRTLAAQTYGFNLEKNTEINYCGHSMKSVATKFRGDVVYCGESETHLPQLTVGDTLMFAARMKTPAHIIPGVSRDEYALHMRDMIMATYGLSHTVNTRVGNDLIRGVSGGERKRVSIAELALCGSQFQCWDNSTRGLDSATAMEFVRSLRNSSDIFGVTSAVALYQASEDIYDCFDRVTVLYDGVQIYYGPVADARKYFIDMGWEPKPRQPTPDFLTSLSSPHERQARPGYELQVPRNAQEFRERWLNSSLYAHLLNEIEAFNKNYTEKSAEAYALAYRAHQSQSLPKNAAYTVSYKEQLSALVIRGFQAMKGDPTMPLTGLIGNSITGFIVASMFYNLREDTGSFFSRNALIFFTLLYNGMNTLLEIFAIYAVRPIVQKHQQYALYHPTLDAAADLIVALPQKVILTIVFNTTIYFIANLRREPGNFFFFLLIAFMTSLMTSHLFRTIGVATRTFTEAMIPANIALLCLVIFSGFVIPTKNMHGWCRWINYLNPMAYSFESLMANEYHNRSFPCSDFTPSYGSGDGAVCSVAGAQAGQDRVLGDTYIEVAFDYTFGHMWRDFGILLGFIIFLLFTYLFIVYINPGSRTKGDVLVYPLRVLRKSHCGSDDVEKSIGSQATISGINDKEGKETALIDASKDIFYWQDVCYDVKIKGETRRLLNYVDGWVKPGTLTALMGASGAGKTTLLDTLANRVTMGVVSGHMYVNGSPRDNTFQRSTGYAMQQDVHLKTSTVREALIFSACLRQPFNVPYAQKVEYVDNVLKILEMESYADAVVGVPGEGLNVEQRKRLTIGVELAAKPRLLLFLDEPTSGLDSQTAWSICQLLKKLSNAGQAILCTIHQPSALLLQQFDRLLFLAKGGRTVYFGDIGPNSSTLTQYFEKHGADPCPFEANPAEWMLHVIGAAPGSTAKHDYADVWLHSEERQQVRAEISRLMEEYNASDSDDAATESHLSGEFAAPLWYQYIKVTERTLKHTWRSPMYIYSKLGLNIFSALFNGFTFFRAPNSIQGLQNLMFAIFMFSVILIPSIQQHLPNYVEQRDQFEVRERPSKMLSWKVFLASQFTSEVPWQCLTAILAFLCWYYPVGFVRHFEEGVTNRSGVTLFFILVFYMFASSLGFLVVAGMGDADSATNIAVMLFSFSLLFCGVLVSKDGLPGFWVFMYRVSPMTYFIGGMLANNLGESRVTCSDYEYLSVTPPLSETCQSYLQPYFSASSGYTLTPDATSMCEFCTMGNTDAFLSSINSEFHVRWRNLGILCAYPLINYFAAALIYWLTRVPKKSSRVAKSKLTDYHTDPALENSKESQ